MLLFSELKTTFLISFSLSILLFILLLQFSEKLKYKTYINFYNPIQTIFFASDLYASEQKKFYFFTPIHDSHYRTAYNIFKDNKIFGAGNKMFRKVWQRSIYINKFSYTNILIILSTSPSRKWNYWLVFIASIFIMIFLKLFKEIFLEILRMKKIMTNQYYFIVYFKFMANNPI